MQPIKVNVLRYNNMENVIKSKIEITPLLDGVYIYQQDGDNIVFEIEGIYVWVANLYKYDNSQDEKIKIGRETFLQRIDSGELWPTTVTIALYEQLGRDTTQLYATREKIRSERIEKARKDKEEADLYLEQRRQEEENNSIIRRADTIQKINQDELISRDEFLELLDFYDIEIHPRTLGMLRSLNVFNINKENVYFTIPRGKAKPKFDKCFEHYNKLLNKIKN